MRLYKTLLAVSVLAVLLTSHQIASMPEEPSRRFELEGKKEVTMLWPVNGRVTSDFGYRRSPFGRRWEFHSGIDIAAIRQTPIVSSADGLVSFVGRERGFGRMIILDHGEGVETVYGHVSKLLVRQGIWIPKGTVIALVGNTGHSTGPHLHYEIHVRGAPADPRRYLEAEAL